MNPLLTASKKLLSWYELSRMGVRDVLVDESTNTVALVGPALKLELSVVKAGFIDNREYRLNVDFAKHFGLPIEVNQWPNSYRVRDTSPMWFHGSDDSGEALEDFLSNLGNGLRDVIRTAGGEIGDEDIRVTLLCDPGYPYTVGSTTHVYSAKTGKTTAVSLPPYATRIKNRDNEMVMAVDFCKLLPMVCATGQSQVAGKFYDDTEFIVTHCTKMSDERGIRADYSETIKKCPGMLFPSLATSLIPATNFGETVLVIHPNIILSGMAPYKKRGAYEVATFRTDVWTETTGEFVGDIAALCWKQLHGDANWYYTNHLYILGPTLKEGGMDGEEVKVITSTKALRTSMAKKFRQWKRDMGEKEFARMSDLPSGDRYGYLESKLNIILGWDCVPYAVCPEAIAGEVSKNLGAFGFKGKILAVPIDDEMLHAVLGKTGGSQASYLIYQYSWIVRDVILNYAKEHGLVFSVQE